MGKKIGYTPVSIFAAICGAAATAAATVNPVLAPAAIGIGSAASAIAGGIELNDVDNNIKENLDEVINKAWNKIDKDYRLTYHSDKCLSELKHEIMGTGTSVEQFVRNAESIGFEPSITIVIRNILEKHREALNRDPEINWDNEYTKNAAKGMASILTTSIKRVFEDDDQLMILRSIERSEGRIIRTVIETGESIIEELSKNKISTAPDLLTIIPKGVDLIGRKEDIKAIREQLNQYEIVAINAGGGVGKTAVALEIVNEVKKEIALSISEFKHVAWITSTQDLIFDLTRLNIPGVKEKKSLNEKKDLIIDFLQKNHTLIVIDNMDTPPSYQENNILNTISIGTKILITTRVKMSKIHGYPLQSLNTQASVRLFYRHYLDTSKELEWQNINNRSDVNYVYNIVKESSYNALLIELISKMACWEYKDRLKSLWEKLKKDIFGTESEIDIEVDHHADYNENGSLSKNDLKLQGHIRRLYTLSGLDENRQELMRFITIFPAEVAIFSDTFMWAGFEFIDIKWLSDRGWIDKNEEGYLIHVMVKGSVELQNREKSFNIWKYESLIEKLIDTEQYMPVTSGYNIVRKKLIVPETVCKFIEKSDTVEKKAFSIYYNLAGVFFTQGDYDKAQEYYEKANSVGKKLLDPSSPVVGASYSGLALIYHTKGDYEKALYYYEKSLEIHEKVPLSNNPFNATVYHNFASIYYARGDYKKALEYNQKALQIREKVFGESHPETAKSYNTIALVYKDLGDYESALLYNGMALVIREEVLGTDHPETALSYNNIGVILNIIGEYEKALECFEKAISISERILGLDHPETAMKYNNIGLVYFGQDEIEKALQYFGKALSIIEKKLGENHPETATIHYNIARVYEKQGYYEQALEFYEKALEIKESLLGPYHPDITMILENIAQIYLSQNNYEKALIYFQKKITIIERTQDQNHPGLEMDYNNLAVLYSIKGEFEKAQKYYEKALAICEKMNGSDDPTTKAIYASLAGMYYVQGNYKMAMKYYEKSMKSDI